MAKAVKMLAILLVGVATPSGLLAQESAKPPQQITCAEAQELLAAKSRLVSHLQRVREDLETALAVQAGHYEKLKAELEALKKAQATEKQ